jgi:hypothetical protein
MFIASGTGVADDSLGYIREIWQWLLRRRLRMILSYYIE